MPISLRFILQRGKLDNIRMERVATSGAEKSKVFPIQDMQVSNNSFWIPLF